jgi:DNA-binding NarL/FixJ family response regulator
MSSEMTRAIRVLIAQASLAIRDRLAAALSQVPDLAVIATASHGKEAIDLTLTLEPDILLLDASMRGMSGLAVLRLLRQEAASVMVVVLSNHGEPIYRDRFLACGAADVLTKGTAIDELEQAIRAVMERGPRQVINNRCMELPNVAPTNVGGGEATTRLPDGI